MASILLPIGLRGSAVLPVLIPQAIQPIGKWFIAVDILVRDNGFWNNGLSQLEGLSLT
jgi:hypothetical protein